MVLAHRIYAHYGMAITDGYISKSKIAGGPFGRSSASLEQSMARHLHSLNREFKKPQGAPPSPEIVHTWVIGNDGWLTKPHSDVSELFQRIHEGECDTNYRIVVLGLGWLGKQPYLDNQQSRLRGAGMTRKKKHSGVPGFHSHCELLMDLMYDRYMETREAPSAILNQFGVPYEFYGDSGKNCEDRSPCRIQQ